MSLKNDKTNKDRILTEIGDVGVILEVEMIDGKPYDTRVMLEDGSVLCHVSGQYKDQFIRELNEVIARYRI